MRQAGNEQVDEDLKWLARGPNSAARRYTGFIINGFRFRTKKEEKERKTQNSGVVVNAKISSFAGANDSNPVIGDVSYYGVLTDIIELDYYEHRKKVLFRCDWFDVLSQGRGIKTDEYGFTLLNFSRLISTGQQQFDEPFVFATQVEQVFYVKDSEQPDWHVVIKTKPRDIFDMKEQESSNDETFWQSEPLVSRTIEDVIGTSDDHIQWVRPDVPGIVVDVPVEVPQPIREDV